MRQALLREFPCVLVPVLPKKGVSKKQPEHLLLNKRKHQYQLFIDTLLSHPVLSNTVLVDDFVRDQGDYSAKVKGMEKTSRVDRPEETWSLDGQQKCVIWEVYDHYMNRLEIMLQYMIALH